MTGRERPPGPPGPPGPGRPEQARAAEPGGPIELVLVGDHAVARAGLRLVLEREPDMRVTGEAGSPEEAVAVVARARPSLVLLGLRLSPASDLEVTELCARLTRAHPGLAVLVLTTAPDERLVVAARRGGARGSVVTEVGTSGLLRVIRATHQDISAPGPRTAPARAAGLRAPAPRPQSLTSREAEVLRFLACGLSNREIARTLFVAETTVKFHVANILRKLEVGRRGEAVSVASQIGALQAASGGAGHRPRQPRS